MKAATSIRGKICLLLVLIASARSETLVHRAPQTASTRSNPFEGQPDAERAGAKLFSRECASCHGAAGAGGLGKAPPLNQPEVYRAAPGTLFWILRNGSLKHGMPSFAHLPEPQRWQIVTHLQAKRQFQNRPTD
jgi:mono/diheme cytochrome c family protein